MSRYQNPQPPEGINTTEHSPFLTAIKLMIGMAVVLILALWLASRLGGTILAQVPISWEQKWMPTLPITSKNPPLEAYLNQVAHKIKPHMDLPEDMPVKVQYSASDIENAFATLGGNLVLFKGLMRHIPNENALAMLIGHEMAHLKHRHPIRSIGQKLATSTVLGLLLGETKATLATQTQAASAMHFSRDMEYQADLSGLSAVAKAYGHAAGALDLYDTLHVIQQADSDRLSDLYRSHPKSVDRIKELQQMIKAQGWNQQRALITPLPKQFAHWLSQ